MCLRDKSEMSEEDIKLNYITPALQARGWTNRISMETSVRFTDGEVNISGNRPTRKPPKRADYVLYIAENKPIAIVEAKYNNELVSKGMQQSKEYAEKMDVKFAYASNGDAFEEYDFTTGLERVIPMDCFPTPEELKQRYEQSYDGGAGMTGEQKKALEQTYYSAADFHSPRYYQRVAINRTVESIAGGRQRILLVMATGTGKTYTAFQIVYRLLESKMRSKVLYLADRNFLIDQTLQQDFAPLASVSHKIDFSKDNPIALKSYQVYFALYQQLSGGGSDAEEEDRDETDEDVKDKYARFFDKDFFDLVIVDECHRGSAKEDSKWRAILEYFSSAAQIGMTATPKETAEVSNITYFGKPIYEYSLNQGIKDGFLAPFRVISPKLDVDAGWRPRKGQTDVNGQAIEDREYGNSDYDRSLILEDRIQKVAEQITEYLKATDRMAKTIVFCETEDAAERMRIALSNCNADMMKEHSDYVVRITGSDDVGKGKLPYFISIGEKYPVIATTSRLLGTGADCKMVKLIVIDKSIGSLTEFKQIIGRGTRLNFDRGKTSFVIMDFRGAARHFSDPEWDGEVEIDENFDPGKDRTFAPSEDGPKNEKVVPIVDEKGCTVHIVQKIVSIYDANGSLLHREDIIDYTKECVNGECASLETFINKWSEERKSELLKEMFDDKGIDLYELKKDQGMSDVDDFDFICHIAFDKKPLTRRERAENVKKRDVFSKYGPAAQEILALLLDRYADKGITEIENKDVLKLEPFSRYGKPAKIAKLFGGKKEYDEAIRQLEEEIYKAA